MPSPEPVPGGDQLTVAVLAGGRSSEHEVSLASAGAVRDALRSRGHQVLWIEIDRDGSWHHREELLSFSPGAGLAGADVVFGALHGPFGEDGVVQGMLEVLDVPYVGAGVTCSALCMDKVLFKDLMSSAGLPQVRYVGLRAERYEVDPAAAHRAIAALGMPVFVKPAHLGSSVGIAKVSEPAGLPDALAAAFLHDRLVIAEAAATGIEVECGVLGSPAGSGGPSAVASEPGEITFSSEFYDYEAKYTAGGMELIVPARTSEAVRRRVMELALSTFELVGCEGLARVDFFVDEEEVLVNELNTMPGFTPTSVYAKLFEASGVPYPALVEQLCRLGIERHRAERALRH